MNNLYCNLTCNSFIFFSSGCYGPDMNLDKLKDFHRRRLQVLVRSCPDLLAFETIPNKLEAQVCSSIKSIIHSILNFEMCRLSDYIIERD